MSAPYKLLFLCTGNICRSPTADAIFRHKIQERALEGRVECDSAGTHGYHIGNPPDNRSMSTASEKGVDMSELRARRIEQSDFYDFDLILAMDDGHMRHLQEIAPADRTANLAMFLDFTSGVPDKNVPDPYYGAHSGFEHVFDLIDRGVDGLFEYLGQKVLI